MSLEMKALLVMAPIALVAMGYALAQGDWKVAGILAFSEMLTFISYRREKGSKFDPDGGSERRREI
jgi:uncharacterized membrane protein